MSGTFEKIQTYVRQKKNLKFSNSMLFCRETIVDIYPGDIVGLVILEFSNGDTLTEGEIMSFKGIPSFSEHLDASIMLILLKQLDKGVDQLMDEEFFTSCLHKK
jgi:peptide chain release factor 3